MNLVIIAGKRSVRPLETALKKSEQTVTVGKYTAVKPNLRLKYSKNTVLTVF